VLTLAQSPTEPGFVQDPYPFYHRARAAGPLFRWDDYNLVCATSHEAVSALLKDRRLGREIPPERERVIPPHLAPFYAFEAHSMLEREPPTHTRLRGLVLRAFTSRRIAALEPEILALCDQLVDAFPAGEVDLLPAYARPIPVIIIARLLGVPEGMADQLLAWSNAMVSMYQARRTRAIEDAAVTATLEFSDFIRGYIAEKRQRPADDLITHLIRAEEDGQKLSTDELITTCILLLNAGHEATVHTIGNSIKAVVEAGAQAALRPETVEATVEEAMRLDPPLHLFTRYVYEDVQLFGHAFRRGDEVGCLLAAANRDPAAFPDPDRLIPGRPARAHSSFGAGVHFCVGAPLARLELRIALARLFARHPGLALDGRPSYANLYHFHGLEALRVRL
jgi:cytochrome P450